MHLYPPDTVDLAFAGLFAVVGAVLDYVVLWPYLRKVIGSGQPGARSRAYRIIMAWEWGLSAFLAARWFYLDRPWAWLGLLPPAGWRLLVGASVVLAVGLLLAAQVRSVSRLDTEKRVALRPRLGALVFLVPHTISEHRWFFGLSATAGVCEELLYRGFLVWAIAPWVGLWVAAGISVVLFGVAHAYQGVGGAIRATLTGAILGGLALLTGSILPGILLHAIIDAGGGTTGYLLLTDASETYSSATPQAPAAPPSDSDPTV